MSKYLFNYIVLVLIFIVPDLFLIINPNFINLLAYLPTPRLIGGFHLLFIIPYSFLVVKFLFINKADKNDFKFYFSIRKKIIIISCVINSMYILFYKIFFNNFSIELWYSIFFLFFMLFLKPKSQIIKENTEILIKEYYKKKR